MESLSALSQCLTSTTSTASSEAKLVAGAPAAAAITATKVDLILDAAKATLSAKKVGFDLEDDNEEEEPVLVPVDSPRSNDGSASPTLISDEDEDRGTATNDESEILSEGEGEDDEGDVEINANAASGSASPATVPTSAEAPAAPKAADANAEILAQTRFLLDEVIASDKLPAKALADRVVSDAVELWNEHVNPGFLLYRKSVSDDYTAVEWEDSGDCFRDIRGREFIDCLGGYGIYNVGHRHPKVVAAVENQLKKQALHSQELVDPLRAYLAHLTSKIASMTGGQLQYSFFSNSGTESVECCLKMAMLATGRKHFIGAVRGFHGKTLGSLAATSKAVFRSPFLPLTAFSHVPFGDAAALRSVLESARFCGNEVAGVLLEPIQGEGGIFVAPPGYLREVRKLCDEFGCMMILDEVQSGMGRSGKWFAFQHEGADAVPDLLALGKAFGGGVMPIGACVGTARAWEAYISNPFLHTTTFGGNPLSCAAAIATINVIAEEGLAEQAAVKGEKMMAGFRTAMAKYPTVLSDVRGQGLMIGLEFPDNEIGYEIAKGLFARGVLCAGTLINARVIRIEPPLTITEEHIAQVLERFDQACAQVASELEAKAKGATAAH